jgi:hypothetical protein
LFFVLFACFLLGSERVEKKRVATFFVPRIFSDVVEEMFVNDGKSRIWLGESPIAKHPTQIWFSGSPNPRQEH